MIIINNNTNMKDITIKVKPDIYFELVSLKGKLKCKTWDSLFRKLIMLSKDERGE